MNGYFYSCRLYGKNRATMLGLRESMRRMLMVSEIRTYSRLDSA